MVGFCVQLIKMQVIWAEYKTCGMAEVAWHGACVHLWAVEISLSQFLTLYFPCPILSSVPSREAQCAVAAKQGMAATRCHYCSSSLVVFLWDWNAAKRLNDGKNMGINPCSAIHGMASNPVEGKHVPSLSPAAVEGRLIMLPAIILEWHQQGRNLLGWCSLEHQYLCLL